MISLTVLEGFSPNLSALMHFGIKITGSHFEVKRSVSRSRDKIWSKNFGHFTAMLQSVLIP